MKIDAIVGNPPFQLTVAKKETDNGQKAVTNIFHYFQILSDGIAKYSALIYPGGRWIHRSGKGLAHFGLQQINDIHLAKLIFYPDANELFTQQGISDGLSIVFKDKNKKSHCFQYIYSLAGERIIVDTPSPGEELIPLNPMNVSIVKRINDAAKKYDIKFLHESIYPRTLFGIESNFVESNPQLVRVYTNDNDIDFSKEVKLFTNDKAGKSGRAMWFVTNRSNITTGLQYLDKWKVVVSSANAGGQKRSNQLAVLDNHSAFGRARVALKIFDTEKEARNFFKYVRSKLIRFAFLMTDEALSSLAKQVPDFKNYSDDNGLIDFDGDINKQLYELFNIDVESQNHIENVLATKAE